MNYEYFLNKAKTMAEISDFHNQHVGCVVVYKNKIVSAGCNSNKTHPIQKEYNKYRFDTEKESSPACMHAEIHALIQLNKLNVDMSKIKVFTYRKMKTREFGMARPCPSCMAYIKKLGIKNIIYSTDDGYAIEKITS